MARVMNSQGTGETGSTPPGSVIFVCGAETRVVPLAAPVPVLRGDRLVVSLMDLWVATLLPGDFLDLTFEIVVASPDGSERRLAPVDALQFARGHLAIDSRSVTWDGACDVTRGDASSDLETASVLKIIVRDTASEVVAPIPPPVAVAPRAAVPSAMARLERMLPRGFSATRYPAVSWRFKKDEPAAPRAITMG